MDFRLRSRPNVPTFNRARKHGIVDNRLCLLPMQQAGFRGANP
jgi:hypothetical protein